MSAPPAADPVGPGQESVWDYPRPPAVRPSERRVVVRAGDTELAASSRGLRVLETSHPPVWYLPRADVANRVLRRSDAPGTVCEWKGLATYWDVVTGDTVIPAAAWSYERPTTGYEMLAGAVTFYPSRVACTVDNEQVQPQPGDFYGGWITADVVGPFKGGPGSWGW